MNIVVFIVPVSPQRLVKIAELTYGIDERGTRRDTFIFEAAAYQPV